jgi:hypothetical protein
MKKLIVYDQSCPMCRLYTKGMVATSKEGCTARVGSNQLTDREVVSRIGPQRARHEIPMVDLDGGETIYGIDTWAYAFGHKSHHLTYLLSLSWLRSILQRLYAFISYNRRIIITSAPGRWQLLDLQPEFRLSYRIPFVLLLFGLVSVLFCVILGSAWPIIGLITTQLLFVSLFLTFTKSANATETWLDYAGHLGMSLLIGGVVVLIGLLFGWSPLALVGHTLIIGQHFIRVYRLGLSPWLSVLFTGSLLLIINGSIL